MKPNCFFLRLDRSKLKNGYYKVLMGLAENILGLILLPLQQLNRALNYFCLGFGFKWESEVTLSNGSITYCL